jgi:hypothetical protein
MAVYQIYLITAEFGRVFLLGLVPPLGLVLLLGLALLSLIHLSQDLQAHQALLEGLLQDFQLHLL